MKVTQYAACTKTLDIHGAPRSRRESDWLLVDCDCKPSAVAVAPLHPDLQRWRLWAAGSGMGCFELARSRMWI